MEPVKEELPNEAGEDQQQMRNEIPDNNDIGDDESAATEVADGAGGENDDEWNAIIENLWNEYDAD